LRITDGDSGTYAYSGARKSSPKNSYVLVFDTNNQTCTLEPLSSSYTFNLQSTPHESSIATLNDKYPPIPASDGEQGQNVEDGSFDEEGVDDGPDPKNPFDYRHFLNQRDEAPPSPVPGGRIDSPRLNAAPTTSERGPRATPKAQAQQPKPKFKISQIAKRGAKAKPAASTTTPSVRLERRASTRPALKKTAPTSTKNTKLAPKSAEFVHDSSSSSAPASPPPLEQSSQSQELHTSTFDGGLEIDFGDSGPPIKRKGAASSLLASAAADLVAAAHNGPISLRSAANSPGGSRVTTPRHQQKGQRRRPTEVEELDLGDAGGDIDLGDAGGEDEEDEEDEDEDEEEEEEEGYVEDNESDEEEEVGVHGRSRADTLTTRPEEDDEEDAEGEDDVDVEPMTLGSPAQYVPQQQQVEQDTSQEQQDEDDDIDMEAAFEAEMMQGLQDDEEESDVSEAE
jgi:RNA polymerase II transcription elongation factor